MRLKKQMIQMDSVFEVSKEEWTGAASAFTCLSEYIEYLF